MTKRLAAFLLLAVAFAFAEGTRTWEQSKFEEFEKGTAKGVAIRSDGVLELAPAFKPLATTPSTYVWGAISDFQGNVFLAAGAPARVYRVTPDGKLSVIFEPQEFQVQALAIDRQGVLYAATSPDGKVYRLEHRAGKALEAAPVAKPGDTKAMTDEEKARDQAKPKLAVDPNWTSSVFYEPKTKYIWALALDGEGRLYVATGDHGEIFRVERKGQGALFFKSDDAHIRCLAFDAKGNLIAGSDGSGLVYRISPAGQAFVLYSAPRKEITALAVDPSGNIYASGVGEKRPGTSPATGAAAATPAPAAMQITIQSPGTPPAATLPAQLPPNFPIPGLSASGSEVYRIAPDGSPKRIWNSREDLVYALAFDSHGALVAGSGNKGRILLIRGEQDFSDLLKASATQVTGFAKAPAGGLYVATSNLGKAFLLAATPEPEGSYQSDVFDARTLSQWGRAEVRATGVFELWARSGNVDNPDRNWSAWQVVDLRGDSPLPVPPARFVQWKAVLRPGTPAPQIDSVTLNYLPKNVAPVVDDVIVQMNTRFQPPARPQNADAAALALAFQATPSSSPERGTIGVRWNAHDDNDDQLTFSIYFRGDGESNWRLLKDNLTDRAYSFDASQLPDGGYRIKVVASDARSNSPGTALTDEHESQHFDVDTTPPRIDDLRATVDGGGLRISFRATDSFSPIKRAEYSLDAGEWQFIEPVGRISDARTESYDFVVPQPVGANPVRNAAAGEHLVVVRVWDRFDNMNSAKTVLRKAAP